VLELRSTDKIDRDVIDVDILAGKLSEALTARGERTFAIAAIEITPADPTHVHFSAQVLNEESETRA
jgi:hypothetical protein